MKTIIRINSMLCLLAGSYLTLWAVSNSLAQRYCWAYGLATLMLSAASLRVLVIHHRGHR